MNHLFNTPMRSYNARQTMNYIPGSKVPAFLKLYDAVVATEGSGVKAQAAIGVCERTIAKARTLDRLTDKSARQILAGYKAWKARQQ